MKTQLQFQTIMLLVNAATALTSSTTKTNLENRLATVSWVSFVSEEFANDGTYFLQHIHYGYLQYVGYFNRLVDVDTTTITFGSADGTEIYKTLSGGTSTNLRAHVELKYVRSDGSAIPLGTDVKITYTVVAAGKKSEAIRTFTINQLMYDNALSVQ